jgi:DNA (cytosine-5)-methyltransferase 1
LFNGIGGFPLAAVKVGIKPVWASEIEAAPISITKRHFPEMRHLGDIGKLDGAEIEPVDIITFGSPCQDLSITGRRAGLAGVRSSLFMEAVRIIKEMRIATNGKYPARIVWENVPGAFSTNRGGDFLTVIEEIAKIAEPGLSIPRPPEKYRWMAAGSIMGNCWSLAWRVLDAQYWGVPQRRRRIFLVASFGNQCAGEILFKPESWAGVNAEGGSEGEGIAANTQSGAYSAGFNGWRSITGSIEYEKDRAPCIQATMPPNVITNSQKQYTVEIGYSSDRVQLYPETAVTIKSNGGGLGAKTGLYCLPSAYCIVGNTIDRTEKTGGNGTGVSEEISYTLNTIDRHAVTVPVSRKGYDCYKESETGKTLQASDDITTADLIVTDYSVRRLTPIECERLQGFPDGWTEYGHDGKRISDSQRYKALGNTVAIPCVVFILCSLKNT